MTPSYTVFSRDPEGEVLHADRVMQAARAVVLRAVERDGRFEVDFGPAVRQACPVGWQFTIIPTTKRARAKWAALRVLVERTLARFAFDAVVLTNVPQVETQPELRAAGGWR